MFRVPEVDILRCIGTALPGASGFYRSPLRGSPGQVFVSPPHSQYVMRTDHCRSHGVIFPDAEVEISDTQVCSSILSSIILRLERTAARIDANGVIEA